MKKLVVFLLAALAVGAVFARGPRAPGRHCHRHRHNSGGYAAGVIGGALVGGLVYDALRPSPVVATVPAPVVVQPAPVVVQPAPVVVQPAPVVVQQPVVVQPVYQIQNVWVAGRYVDQVQPNGTVLRVWQPGHYEQRQVRVN